MVTASEGTRSPASTARRLRKQERSGLDSNLIIVCPDCGDSFSIASEVPCADSALAKSRGAWLLEHFVWDHIQETRHRGSIPLPSAEELRRIQASVTCEAQPSRDSK